MVGKRTGSLHGAEGVLEEEDPGVRQVVDALIGAGAKGHHEVAVLEPDVLVGIEGGVRANGLRK